MERRKVGKRNKEREEGRKEVKREGRIGGRKEGEVNLLGGVVSGMMEFSADFIEDEESFLK